MHVIIVQFDVDADFRCQFIAAALDDGRNSLRDEPGTLRFELIVDVENPNRFFLSEGYVDESAFEVHKRGEHFRKFFEVIDGRVDGPRFAAVGNVISIEPEVQ